MVIRKNVGKDGWAFGVCAGLGACLLVAAACAGGDTPPRDGTLEDKILKMYDPGFETGAAGSVSMTGSGGGSGAGGSSASGAGGSSSGTGGAVATGGTAGAAGSGSSGASGSGSSGASGSGSSGSGSTGAVCDAVTQVFSVNCSFQPCHGDGSTHGAFSDSEASAKALLDKPTTINASCGKFIDSSNPNNSALLTKLTQPVCGGAQMPFNLNPLSADDVACVKSWLSQF